MYLKKLLFILTFLISLVYSSSSQVENKQQRFARINPDIISLIGIITSEQNNPLTEVLLTVIDNDSHDFIGNYSPEISTGIYSINLNKLHNYQIIVECKGYFAYLAEVKIGSESKKEITKDIIIPDSYRKSFDLYFDKIEFSEINVNTLSLIGSLMSDNVDMKLRLVYEEDSISGILADSVFLRFNSLGFFSDRVLSSQIAPKDPEEYIVDLKLKHGIFPEIITQINLDEAIIESIDLDEINIQTDSVVYAEDEEGEPKYTIQLAAAKKPFKPGHFQGLTDVKVYHSTDGYYRYTCGKFVAKKTAEQRLIQLKEKGYSQAYIREIKEYIE